MKLFNKNKDKQQSANQERDNDTLSRICWIEIPVNDINRATKFYKNVFKSEFDYHVFNDIGYAFFKSSSNGFKGTLVETNETIIGKGILLFIKVEGFMITALKNTPIYGGEIMEEKK